MSVAQKHPIWKIWRRLFTLSSTNLYEVAKNIAGISDTAKFIEGDEKGCVDYITSYLQSDTLLELEDKGMSESWMTR